MQLPPNLASAESRPERDARELRSPNKLLWLGILLALLLGAALRFPQLDTRPMHNDEGVNAVKLHQLWEHGAYEYDPQEYHGPTLPYFTWAWMKIIGPKNFVDFNESQLRALTVLFGLGLIALIPLIADGLGRKAAICAALLTAISPAMTFYSRYYIHEMLLVFFTFLALAAGWRWWRSRRIGWALLVGGAIGLMQATKETFLLAIVALAAAVVVEKLLNRKASTKAEQTNVAIKNKMSSIVAVIAIWLIVALVLFSSFFTNWHGPMDAVRTYLPWLHRAGGASPHIHPWNFYFERLAWFHIRSGPVWSEALILFLALIGLFMAFVRKPALEGDSRFLRLLALYTIFLTAIYCGISYKTPWCLLNFWQPMILLAGFGTVALLHAFRELPLQILAGAVLVGAAGQLTLQGWRADVDYAADTRNPYVYAQTAPDAEELVALVKALAAVSPEKQRTIIKVMAPANDYGPLQWFLRGFDNVGWWSELPQDPYAPVMIVSTKFKAALDKDKSHIMAGLFQLRPGAWFELYVDAGLWGDHVNRRSASDMRSVGTDAGK